MPYALTLRCQVVYRVLLLLAVALSMTMALVSTTAKQVHHDEYDHANAARYFTSHWLPPAVVDPGALDTYSVYGASYLNEWDIVYPLAGKFATLLNPLVGDFVLSVRLFNVCLFLLLGCIALLSRNSVLGYAVLLTSPQIWYVFSYFNGDAFPLFVSFLIVALVAAPNDGTAPESRWTLQRYLLLGFCIGLLVLSKKTFWAFGLFAGGLAAWLEFCIWLKGKDRARSLCSLGVLAAAIAVTAAPRIAYDLYINGTPAQKQAKVNATLEALAIPAFKPSTSVKDSLNLRRKGVSLLETLGPPYSWARTSLFTMFGAYNYTAIKPSPPFFYLILGIYGTFFTYVAAVVLMRGNTREKVVLGGVGATVILVVALAIYHSWVGDFQAQGRYLFAIFGVVAVLVARNIGLMSMTVVNLCFAMLFTLSAYSFTKHGLLRTPEFRDLVEIAPVFRRPG